MLAARDAFDAAAGEIITLAVGLIGAKSARASGLADAAAKVETDRIIGEQRVADDAFRNGR